MYTWESLLQVAYRAARRVTRDVEAESIAHTAMLKAVRAYDPERGIPLERFVSFAVKRNVYCWLRDNRRMKQWDMLCISQRDVPYREKPERSDAEDVRKLLSAYELAILLARHANERSIRSIADEHGVSYSRMAHELECAEKKLRRRWRMGV